jgi:hypothetical protein
VGEVLKIQSAYESPNADLYRVSPAIVHGADLDALKFQAFVEVSQILLIA